MPTSLLLAAITIIGIFLRFYLIDAQSIWLDETTSLFVAEQSVYNIIAGIGFDQHTPPAYYIILHYWLKLFGSSANALRGFSAVFDSINILLIWSVANRLFGYRAALYTAAIFAVSPYLIFYAQEGRMYESFGSGLLECNPYSLWIHSNGAGIHGLGAICGHCSLLGYRC